MEYLFSYPLSFGKLSPLCRGYSPLSIDTKKKRVRVRLELVGEAEPIEVEITKYNLKNKDSGARLTIEEATASREWLAVALREFVVGRTIEIAAKAGALLKLLT